MHGSEDSRQGGEDRVTHSARILSVGLQIGPWEKSANIGGGTAQGAWDIGGCIFAILPGTGKSVSSSPDRHEDNTRVPEPDFRLLIPSESAFFRRLAQSLQPATKHGAKIRAIRVWHNVQVKTGRQAGGHW